MKRFFVILAALSMLSTSGCHMPPPLPPVGRPVAGYWFDTFRARRAAMQHPDFIAGSAIVRLTPSKPGVRIAGHGHWHKHSKGVLDDVHARVLYLDSGRQALVLVSLEFIGFMHQRVDRIRARVTREHPESILIASTHNHDGPDTEGLWGEPVLGLIPIKSGVDRAYLDLVERKVAGAILHAVSTARPARLFLGRFMAPKGLVVNMREPEDVPLQVLVLRAAGLDGFTIGTLVDFGNHAEALQDKNRWLSADWPGVLCRQVDAALGGTTLFFSGPAGGMLEPANDPDDPEPARIAFMNRLGGALAEGVIDQAIDGMEEIPHPRIERFTRHFELPIDASGIVALAMKLHLLEPRPMHDGRLSTEAALVNIGPLQMITIPGEVSPAFGRLIAAELRARYKMIITLGLDHLAYMITPHQWKDPRFDYEREMSLGPQTTSLVLEQVKLLAKQAW